MAPGTKDRAYQRMFTLLGMPGKVDTPEMWESIGKYGLGTKRTLEQYQEFIGVNLSTLEVKIVKTILTDCCCPLSRASPRVGAKKKSDGRGGDAPALASSPQAGSGFQHVSAVCCCSFCSVFLTFVGAAFSSPPFSILLCSIHIQSIYIYI